MQVVENLSDGVIDINGESLGRLGDVSPSHAVDPFQAEVWNRIRYWGLRKVVHHQFGVVFQALVKSVGGPAWINLSLQRKGTTV